MKTVIITGSARGLGFEMVKCFRKANFNVVISDINESGLLLSKAELEKITSSGLVKAVKCDVSVMDDVKHLYQSALEEFGTVDIFINNAGVNQSPCHAWELDEKEVQFLLNVDLKGAINGCIVAMNNMNKQGYGAIYNVEGFGSNDAFQENLSVYGTTKRAITYFTDALAFEIKATNSKVIVGKLSPGIMITSFLTSSNGKDNSQGLSDKVKNVYNILGDYPDVIASFLVKNMIKNTKNNKRIAWLTNAKAFKRFMCAGFNKRDFFSENE